MSAVISRDLMSAIGVVRMTVIGVIEVETEMLVIETAVPDRILLEGIKKEGGGTIGMVIGGLREGVKWLVRGVR
jgi:hypothetical protein